jgi:hypothetical protein
MEGFGGCGLAYDRKAVMRFSVAQVTGTAALVPASAHRSRSAKRSETRSVNAPSLIVSNQYPHGCGLEERQYNMDSLAYEAMLVLPAAKMGLRNVVAVSSSSREKDEGSHA